MIDQDLTRACAEWCSLGLRLADELEKNSVCAGGVFRMFPDMENTISAAPSTMKTACRLLTRLLEDKQRSIKC